jgi:hypothetical protein
MDPLVLQLSAQYQLLVLAKTAPYIVEQEGHIVLPAAGGEKSVFWFSMQRSYWKPRA